MVSTPAQETTPPLTTDSRIAVLEEELSKVTAERDRLRDAYKKLQLELLLLRRRIFVAKAERVDTAQLEFEFAQKLAELDKLAGLDKKPSDEKSKKKKPRRKPTGRRNLRLADLEEERVELTDPLFEELVAQGKAERIGVEESSKLAHKRGGMRRLVVAKVKYAAKNSLGTSEIVTAAMPKETFPGCLAAPSMLAHIAVMKHCDGMPLYRLEDRFERDGFRIDRGTMCRWLEDMGATFGATVVAAAREEAMRTAFCLATDAKGVLIQPEPRPDAKRQPCRRGHFFVIVADRDHIFFEYTPKETSAVVAEMFKNYSGYIQADAKSVYDILFREPLEKPPDEEAIRKEIGCWSHARRKYWEAAVAKSVIGREGLARIGRIFDIDDSLKGKPPDEIKLLRDKHLKPHLEGLFVWAEEQYELVHGQRGLPRSALGYTVRQKDALMRVLEDGRLKLENNRSERALRKIAIGRKAWLFCGSDDHAEAAGHLFTMIASARLHHLDPEAYIRDMIRILGQWPNDRYLELAPKHWRATRARLDQAELEQEIGHLTIPPPFQIEDHPA
ncbi:IS66 family transposase [Myxococcota bacterium]